MERGLKRMTYCDVERYTNVDSVELTVRKPRLSIDSNKEKTSNEELETGHIVRLESSVSTC
jgi:hypothetical protein